MNYTLKILIVRLFVFIGVFGYVCTAFGDEPQIQDLISLDKAIDLALKNNPRLAVAAEKINKANFALKATRSAMLPTIQTSASYLRIGEVPTFSLDIPDEPSMNFSKFSPEYIYAQARIDQSFQDIPPIHIEFMEHNSVNVGVGLIQPFTSLIPLYYMYMLKKVGVNAAELDQRITEESLKLQVENTYYNILSVQKNCDVIAESIRVLEAHLEDVKILVKEGIVHQNSELQVKVRLSELRTNLIKTNGAVRVAIAWFNSLVGFAPGRPTKLVDIGQAEGIKPELPDLDECRRLAPQNRLELKLVDQYVNMAHKGVSLSRTGFYPQSALIANYGYAYGVKFDMMPEWNWYAGVVLEWTIWDFWKTGYKVKQAKSNVRQYNFYQKMLLNAILLQVEHAHAELSVAVQSIKASKLACRQAKENYELTSTRYKSGMSTDTQVLDAEFSLTNARQTYCTALYGYLSAKARLDAAVWNAGGIT